MNEKQKFDVLVKKFFKTVTKRNPDLATFLGIHKYDHLVPDQSLRAVKQDLALYKKYLQSFKKIDPQKLDFDGRIDRELAVHFLSLEIFSLEELKQWEKNPDVVSSAGDYLFLLQVREFAPFSKRLQSIISRMEKIPRAIEQTKTRVRKPVKLWVQMAIESCDRIPSFLESIYEMAVQQSIDKKTLARLQKAKENALKAIANYKKYLQGKLLGIAEEEFAIGKKKFDKLLELRKLGLTREEILKFGEESLQKLKQQLKEIAEKIKPGASLEEVKQLVESKRPNTFEEILKTYRESIVRAKTFVLGKKVATIPPKEKLTIIPTPVYMRHFIPFAAYFPPAKFDKIQHGIYVVTPTEQGNFGRYNYADVHNTSVHEGYPGHHLQMSCAAQNNSLIRLFIDATEFVEGWAHYCEEYMREVGYDDSLDYQFVQTKDMMWRAARIIVDIKLSIGKMSFDEAVNFLVNEAGLDKEGAVAEVKRYTQSPSYQLSYLLGKHLIKQLKEEVKQKIEKKFSDKFFHDTLLYAGSLPIYFHRKILEEKIKAT